MNWKSNYDALRDKAGYRFPAYIYGFQNYLYFRITTLYKTSYFRELSKKPLKSA